MRLQLIKWAPVLIMMIVLNNCATTGDKGSGGFNSVDSIVKAFNDAGIVHYKLDDKSTNNAYKNMYTQFAGGAKVIKNCQKSKKKNPTAPLICEVNTF